MPAPPRSAAIALACAVAIAAASGCGTGVDQDADGPLTVYVSVPLRGASAASGRDVRDGAKLALEQADDHAGGVEVRARFLDDTAAAAGGPARWDAATVAHNARAASEDTSAIAYIGDFESGATRVSLPITNQAMVPQVSPASTALDLATPGPDAGTEVPELVQPTGERTFVCVIPDDGVQAEAAAAWARKLGARRVVIVSDGSEYGDLIAEEFSEQAEVEGVAVIAERRLATRRGGGLWFGALQARAAYRADLVYLAGASPELLPEAPPGVKPAIRTPPLMLASDALLQPATGRSLNLFERFLRFTSSAQDPRQLPNAGQDFEAAFRREYGRAPGPYAAYGYEAMALVLDAIERAGAAAEDRRAVLEELLATSDRDSVLGTYSITAVGNTTLAALAGYRIKNREPVFDLPLGAP